MPDPAQPADPTEPEPSQPDASEPHPLLEAFNAEDVVEHPDQPQASAPDTPAGDADAPPPPG